ncbi:MAG TPA: Clp protease N-terminal domain-containing protein [Candidatus Obscuribacter sp.]|nr:Clp protease N-terminal domain-containing protein [Candidatus Obscuribacter sp.]
MQPSEILLSLVGRDDAGRPQLSGFDLITNIALRHVADQAFRSGRPCGVLDLLLSLYSVLPAEQADLVWSHGYDEQKLRRLINQSEPGTSAQAESAELNFPYCFDDDVCLCLLGARGIAARVGAVLVGGEHLLLALVSTGNARVLDQIGQGLNLSTLSSALFERLTLPEANIEEDEPNLVSGPASLSQGIARLVESFSNELYRACREAEASALAACARQVEVSHLVGRLFAASSIGLPSSDETGDEPCLLAAQELAWSESLLSRLAAVRDSCLAENRLVEVLDVLSELIADQELSVSLDLPVLLPGCAAASVLLQRLRTNQDLNAISEELSLVYDHEQPFSRSPGNVHLFSRPIILAAFGEETLKDWLHAEWQAKSFDLPCVYDDVLLSSLLRHGARGFTALFGKLGVDERSLYSELRSLRRGTHGRSDSFASSRLSAASICSSAYGASLVSGSAVVEPRHLLYAILSALDSFSLRLMRSLGAHVDNLYFYGQIEHLVSSSPGTDCESFVELPNTPPVPGHQSKPGSDWLEEFHGWKDERPYPRFSDPAWSVITSAIARAKADRSWVACTGDLLESIIATDLELVGFLSVYGNYSAEKVRSSLPSTCLSSASENASSVSMQVSAAVRRVLLRATVCAGGAQVESKHILYALLSSADSNQVTRGLARVGLNRWKLAYNLHRTMCRAATAPQN